MNNKLGKNNIILNAKQTIDKFQNKKIIKNKINDIQIELEQNEEEKKVLNFLKKNFMKNYIVLSF